MKQDMICLLDMDGPMAAFDDAVWDYILTQGYPCDITTLADSTKRFLTDHLPSRGHRAEVRRKIETTHWFRDLPVTSGALDGVDQLYDAFNGNLWVVTKPLEANPWCRDDKALWISENFPLLTRHLIIAPEKWIVNGDILIDDAIPKSWVHRAPWVPVTFVAPFNGEGTEHHHGHHWTWGDPVEPLVELAWRRGG